MKEIEIFENAQFGQIRTSVTEQGDPLFCLTDVCKALDINGGTSNVKSRLNAKGVISINTPTNGGNQQLNFITEPNLYKCIFQSRKKKAELFQDWVCSVVLPSIRKTGQYSSSHSTSVSDQLHANLMFADWNIKQFNLNEASKLGWARTIGDKFGLVTDALPQAVNAGTANPTTHSATDLLKRHNVGLSARAFNKVLELKGVVKQATRPGRYGKVHTWFVLQPQYDRFGENQQNPQYQQQTQIRWYDATFDELLAIVGLSRQQTLQL